MVSITNDLRANYTNGQNGSQTFILGAGVSGPNVSPGDLTYQWQRAEPAAPTVFNNILDGTGNNNQDITPLLTVAADNGAEYRCIAFVGDVTTGHAATSTVATLTVTFRKALRPIWSPPSPTAPSSRLPLCSTARWMAPLLPSRRRPTR